MAKRPKRKSAPDYTEIFAKVVSYNVRLTASLNHDAFAPQHALGDIEEDPFFKFGSTVELVANIDEPKKMAEGLLAVTIYGRDKTSDEHNKKLKDIQLRDEHGSPKYRKYRGSLIPVYDTDRRSIGYFQKRGGEQS